MYAVIKTGGKQYRVTPGEKLKVEKLLDEVGSNIVLNKVLMMVDGDNVTIGAPLIAGASVPATVLSHGRGDKVMIFKFRRRKHYRKTQGHRQSYTEIQIGEFGSGSANKPAKVAKPEVKAVKTEEKVKVAAAEKPVKAAKAAEPVKAAKKPTKVAKPAAKAAKPAAKVAKPAPKAAKPAAKPVKAAKKKG
jgi:large subunit ribosomal protein L21